MYTDFKAGKMISTENTLDLAIGQNDIFFLIETPNGGRRLTRDGAFSLSSNGELITKNGCKVLDKNEEYIELPVNSRINFSENGTIYADGDEITTLFFAQPQNLSELEKVGDNLFVLPNKRDKLKEGITNKIDRYLAKTDLEKMPNDDKVDVLRIFKTEINDSINETISHTKEIYPETKTELKNAVLETLALELSLLDKFKFETKQKIFNDLKPQIEKSINNIEDKQDMITEIEHSLNCETLRSGFIETSNINMVKEMTNLIETNRLIEMYQKVMTSQNDDMNREAITKLATTKG
jgi:flagellar basal body rod protein FlgG